MIEHVGQELVRDYWQVAAAAWEEAARISAEDLSPEELDLAATYPDDVFEAIEALAPVVARHVHPDVVGAIAAIVAGSAASSGGDGPGAPPVREECPGPMDNGELSERVRRIERTLRAAGAWLGSSTGPDKFALVVLAAVVGQAIIA